MLPEYLAIPEYRRPEVIDSLPDGIRHLRRDARAEAASLLHHAITEAAQHGTPEETIREAMAMVREDEMFDLEAFRFHDHT